MTEQGEVRFGDTRFAYRIVRSRRRHKTVEITIDGPGEVAVAAPAEMPAENIEATLRRRAAWILRHLNDPGAQPAPRRFVSGESLPYMGRSVRLEIHPFDGKRVGIRFHHWQFDVDVPRCLAGDARHTEVRAAFESWYRERAAQKLPSRVDRIAQLLGVTPTAVLIRNQQRRWASCASDGTLRFNWRALMVAPALLDYVVAHELAHLRVRNHNAEYWALVAQAVPDYRLRRQRLRETGFILPL